MFGPNINSFEKRLLKQTLLIGIATIPCMLTGQTGSRRPIPLEFHISTNKMVFREADSNSRMGYGLGIGYAFRSEKTIDLHLGFEYNHTSRTKETLPGGHFQQSYNVTLTDDCLALSLGPELNLGTRMTLFIGSGIYGDMVLKSRMTGERDSCTFDKEGLVFHRVPFNENADLSGTAGVYAGGGLRIPVSGFVLLVGADYRHGFNPILYSYDTALHRRYFRIKLGIILN